MIAATTETRGQGAVIGGWICLALGTAFMFWSWLTFVLYLPLFFASFVLGIVAIAQSRFLHGISTLLLSVVVPLVIGFGLASYHAQQALESSIKKPFNKSDHLFETVKLVDVLTSDDLVKTIRRYDKIDPDYAKHFKIARFDINSDGEKEILYTHAGNTGSCGYSWEILINKGAGKFEKSEFSIPCTGLTLSFSNETVKEMRIPYFEGNKVEYWIVRLNQSYGETIIQKPSESVE